MSETKSFRQLIGAPTSTATINDSTLIIIDAQNEYSSGLLSVVNVAQSRAAISSVLEKYRNPANKHGGKNIVHIVHETSGDAPVFTSSTELAEEFDELKQKEQDTTTTSNGGGKEKLIVKQKPSSFAGTELDGYLKGLGAVGKKVVLTGYMAHVCVSTTARAAAELGYEVVVVEDAVGDRDIPGVKGEEVTRVALREIGDAFGTVIQSGDVGTE